MSKTFNKKDCEKLITDAFPEECHLAIYLDLADGYRNGNENGQISFYYTELTAELNDSGAQNNLGIIFMNY